MNGRLWLLRNAKSTSSVQGGCRLDVRAHLGFVKKELSFCCPAFFLLPADAAAGLGGAAAAGAGLGAAAAAAAAAEAAFAAPLDGRGLARAVALLAAL